METSQSRRVMFHEHKKPSVCFTLRDQIYSGQISDISDDDLSLVCDSAVQASSGDQLTALYIGAIDENHRIENVHIARVRYSESDGRSTLRVTLRTQEQIGRVRFLLGGRDQRKDFKRPEDVDATRLPKISPSLHNTDEGVQTRLQWLRAITGEPLTNLEKHAFRVESLAGNIENFVGAVQIPVGIAGPLWVKGLYANDHFPLPLATSEGALIASLNRGAMVLNKAGGITAHVRRQKMLRAPVFYCEDLHGALQLERWIHDHEPEIREKCSAVSSVAKLIELNTFVFANTVHVQFYYFTGDAAGQNMTTSSTYYACEWIKDQVIGDPLVRLRKFTIEGNMSGDKKVNAQNFIKGRGVGVMAEAEVSDELLQKYLRVSSAQLLEMFQTAEVGAAQIGMMGHNVNVANVIAGMFTALGQDIASVHESSLGLMKVLPRPGGVHLSMFLPSLAIGTVGGGTKLPTQLECLKILGCSGQGQLYKLAEIIASACLALDLSTLAAVATNEFVSAHNRFGRNRPDQRLTKAELNSSFLQSLVGDRFVIQSAVEKKLTANSGIINEIISKKVAGVFGLFRFDLQIDQNGNLNSLPAMLKLKSSDDELVNLALGIARLSGDDTLPGVFAQHQSVFGLEGCDQREIDVYRLLTQHFSDFVPKLYGSRIDRNREIYALLMEDISDSQCLDTVNSPEQWTQSRKNAVLSGIARIHAEFMNNTDKLPESIKRRSARESILAIPVYEELLNYAIDRFPLVYQGRWVEALKSFLSDASSNYTFLEEQPHTLIHGDFNTRNIALREVEGQLPTLVAYDWELARIHVPHQDAIEFLVYSSPESSTGEALVDQLEKYRLQLEGCLGVEVDRDLFFKVCRITAIDFALNRFGLYWLVHNAKKFSFLERVTGNLSRLIEELSHVSS